MTPSEESKPSPSRKTLGSRPEFYLVYLVFYFFPWLWLTPSKTDVFMAIILVAMFLPIYFHASKRQGQAITIVHIGLMTLIGFVAAPFLGSHGVFHIYASVQAAFLRPERKAWIVTLILAVCFTVFWLALSLPWWDLAFPLMMGFFIAVGTIYNADQQEQTEILERSREVDQQMAALAERERIAQDLHDLLGQTLTMVTLKSEVAAKLFDKDPVRAKQEIDEIRSASRTALQDVREAVAGMNRTTLEKELQRADQILASAGVTLTIKGTIPTLSTNMDQTLGLAVRESMTNIARHANAKKASFSINELNEDLTLVIEDDGASVNFMEGSGLKGLRNRIERLGGQAHFDSSSGMRISLRLPQWRTVS